MDRLQPFTSALGTVLPARGRDAAGEAEKPAPDLIIESVDALTTGPVRPNQAVPLDVTVMNTGTADAPSFEVMLDGDVQQVIRLKGLAAGAKQKVQMGPLVGQYGKELYIFTATVDPTNEVPESKEWNNDTTVFLSGEKPPQPPPPPPFPPHPPYPPYPPFPPHGR